MGGYFPERFFGGKEKWRIFVRDKKEHDYETIDIAI